jgi:hypothetical protein
MSIGLLRGRPEEDVKVQELLQATHAASRSRLLPSADSW